MKLLFLVTLAACGQGLPAATNPGVRALAVQVHLPEQAVSGHAIPVDLTFKNKSSGPICFAFGDLAIVDHGLGSFQGATLNAIAQGGGGSEKERACAVAGETTLMPGERRPWHIDMDAVTQTQGEGLLWLSLSIPVFGATCDCEKAQFLKVSQSANVQIL
jgi:hypothetical protein